MTLLALAFAFGAIVGSFANVCIHRLPRGKSVVSPRSACPGCAKPIAWFDNVPLLSYAVLNGRCRGCRARIPFRYPLVEALTGLLFALVFWRHLNDPRGQPLSVTAVYLVVMAGLVIVTFIDLDFRIIFDSFSTWAAVAALPLSLLVPELHVRAWPPLSGLPASGAREGLVSSAAGAASGIALIYGMHLMGVGYLWLKARVTGRRWDPEQAVVGGGDLRLMAAVGGLLGWQAAVVVFFLAPVFGALVGIPYRILTHDEYIAYGPFLALATVLVMLSRREMLDFLASAFHHPAVL